MEQCPGHAVAQRWHLLDVDDEGGPTLAHRLAEGPVPVREALTIAAQIASALHAAHTKGIVHRDLKPANVVIASDGSIKVVDFGLATAPSPDDETQSNVSRGTGSLLGTVSYMSPEQTRGRTTDAATDIWALGCVLYEMLTGRVPFPGDTVADTIAAIIDRTPDWSRLPPDTPSPVRRLLRRALDKDPNRRWHSAADLQLELEDIVRNGADEALAEPVITRSGAGDAGRSPLRPTLILAAGGGLLMAVGLVLGIGLRAPVPLPEMRLQIVTPDGWEPASFALSPDGRQLVYQGTADGRTLLWLRPLDSEIAQPLAGTDDGYFPFWSPSGESIGFFRDYQLQRLDLASELVRLITKAPHARGATWNAAGSILYASSSGPLLRISANGGAPSDATRLLPGHLNHRFPQFLPDGRRFLFVAVGTPETRGIYIGSLDSMETRRVLDIDTSASFLPSNHVLFARQGALWALPVTPEGQRRGDPVLVAGQVMTHPDVAAHKAHSSSASGTIAYRAASGEHRLVWLNRAGQEIGEVGGPDVGQPGYFRLSPDGRTVAMRRTSAGNTDVWLTDIDRERTQRV